MNERGQAQSRIGATLEQATEAYAAGRLDGSERLCGEILENAPGHAEAIQLLGMIAFKRGDAAGAIALLERALRADERSAVAHCNLGFVLLSQGKPGDAAASLRRALELRPDYPVAQFNLGNAYVALNQPELAAECYERAIVLKQNYVEALLNHGIVHLVQGRLEDAASRFRQVLERQPDSAEANHNLGVVLERLDKLEEAIAFFRRALRIRPAYVEAHTNLGCALMSCGDVGEAISNFRRALELDPGMVVAHSNLIFAMDFLESVGVEQQQQERRRWYARHAEKYRSLVQPFENVPDPRRRLRVGYVSADLREHSASRIFAPVILHQERSAFEVFCYSESKLEDAVTRRLRDAASGWRVIAGESDEAAAQRIRQDGIDILVDLSGHSAGNRLLVFACKPAPVQVSAWGHATGTGVPSIDYLFSDPVAIPPGERHWFVEEVVDLPCCVCYEAPPYAAAVSPLPAAQGKPFTFGCLNRVEKVSERVLSLWARILREVPQARLLLKDRGFDEPAVQEKMLQRLERLGVPENRVLLYGATSHVTQFRVFHEVDVCLDPFPMSGGVSTAEALWMGVPVVTLLGQTAPSRGSASILAAAAMPEWIAKTEEQYAGIALGLAGDLPGLALTRQGLRARMAASAAGDVRRYTRAVEQTYRSLWRRWCGKIDRGDSGR